MLSGEHAAVLHAKPQDVGAKAFRLVEFVRVVRVIEDKWVEIAVSGVKHVGDPQAVFLGQLRESVQDLR
jgi:hypothetical protein